MEGNQLDWDLIDSTRSALELSVLKFKLYTLLTLGPSIFYTIIFGLFVVNLMYDEPVNSMIMLYPSSLLLTALIIFPAYFFLSFILFLTRKSYKRAKSGWNISPEREYVYEDQNFKRIYSVSEEIFYRLSASIGYLILLFIYSVFVYMVEYWAKNMGGGGEISNRIKHLLSGNQIVDLSAVMIDVLFGTRLSEAISQLDYSQSLLFIKHLPAILLTYLFLSHTLKLLSESIAGRVHSEDFYDYWSLIYHLHIELRYGELRDQTRGFLLYSTTSIISTILYLYILYFIFG